MAIDCQHPRRPVNQPGQSDPRLEWQPPSYLPGLPADASRAILDALRGIYGELLNQARRSSRVPLIDQVQQARPGQTIFGTGGGQTVVFPVTGPFSDPITLILTALDDPVTLAFPDGTTSVLTAPGVYDVFPDEAGGWEPPPGSGSLGPILAGVTAPTVLGRETAGTGEVEQLAVGAGLELNGGIRIALQGVTTTLIATGSVVFTKLPLAPSSGFIGATAAGSYAHLSTVQAASLVASDLLGFITSTSIVQNAGALERAAVTGDVEIAQNSNTATIPADTVANSQLVEVPQATLKGRASGAGTGNPQDLSGAQAANIVGPSIGAFLTSVSIGQIGQSLVRNALTGDVTAAQNSNATTIPNDTIDNARLANMAAATIKGRALGAGTGDPTDLSAAQVAAIVEPSLTYPDATDFASASVVASGGTLQRAALTGDVTASQNSNSLTIPDDTVSNAQLANMANFTFKARNAGTTGDPQDLSTGAVVAMLDSASVVGNTGTGRFERAALTGDVTATQNSNSLTIPNDTVTNAKLSNMAAATIKGRASGAGTGDPTDLTAAQAAAIVEPFISATPGNDSVTNAILSNMAQSTIKGRANGAGTGDPTDLSGQQAGEIIASNATSLSWAAGMNFDATATFNSICQPLNAFRLNGVSSPGSASSFNNVAVASVGVLRLTPSVDGATLTGMVASGNGQIVIICNLSSTNNLDISNESGSSTAANRFTVNQLCRRVLPNSFQIAWKDGTSSRWRILGFTNVPS